MARGRSFVLIQCHHLALNRGIVLCAAAAAARSSIAVRTCHFLLLGDASLVGHEIGVGGPAYAAGAVVVVSVNTHLDECGVDASWPRDARWGRREWR